LKSAAQTFRSRRFSSSIRKLRSQPYTYSLTTSFATRIGSTRDGQEQHIMEPFVYNPGPGRVVFGSGTIQKLPEEITRLNLSAPLLLSTPQQIDQAEALKEVLQGKIAGIFSEATMHTPTNITEKALEFAKHQKADSIISIGGGSTTGLGKAISIRTGLPHISIPTTYAGSEMTNILGETADGVKKTRSDPKIFPGTVIYDVDLTMTLPASMSATSGVNAIAHAGKPCPLLVRSTKA
jgi:alcohol dehydrogenase class IV